MPTPVAKKGVEASLLQGIGQGIAFLYAIFHVAKLFQLKKSNQKDHNRSLEIE